MFRKKKPTEQAQIFEKVFLRKKTVTPRRSVFHKEEHFPWAATLLWGAFSAVSGYMLLFAPVLTVNQIEISGESIVPDEEYQRLIQEELDRRFFWVIPQNTYVLIPKERIQKTLLERYPKLASVDTVRSFPDTLEIRMTEKPVFLLWCSGGPCYVLSGERAETRENIWDERYQPYRLSVIDASAVPVRLHDTLPVERYLAALEYFYQEMPRIAGTGVSENAATPSRFSGELKLTTKEGWELFVSVDRPFEETLGALDIFLKQALTEKKERVTFRSIDLRVEGKIFFSQVGEVGEEVTVVTPPGETVSTGIKESEKDKKKNDR